MYMDDSDKLENAIRAFQKALKADVALPIGVLGMFPRGSCKPSSMLLAKYLVDINLAYENEIFLSTKPTSFMVMSRYCAVNLI